MGRGLVAAVLLAVPVSVAAAIGFEGSLAGLGDGLGSLAGGPSAERTPVAPGASATSLSDAVETVAAGRGDAGAGPADAGATPSPGGPAPAPGAGTAPGAGGSPLGGQGGAPGGTGGAGTGTGAVGNAVSTGGGAAGQLLEDVDETVTGLLGGSR